MAKVQFNDVSFSYGDKKIIQNLSLEVNDGEIMGVIGPSGCGKTTLIRLLCGFIKPETGSIFIGETCVFDAKKRINIPPERRNIGVVFQDYAVWPHLTVLENVKYPLKKKRMDKKQMQEIAMNILDIAYNSIKASTDGNLCKPLTFTVVRWTTATCGDCSCTCIIKRINCVR